MFDGKIISRILRAGGARSMRGADQLSGYRSAANVTWEFRAALFFILIIKRVIQPFI
jgi:hypothetical protein